MAGAKASWPWRVGVLRLALAIVLVMWVFADTASAAIIEQATVISHGRWEEIDFAIRGRAPPWRAGGSGQELRIELDHSRIAAAARCYGPARFPLVSVSMNGFDGGRVRLVLQISGRIDYVVARLRHELVVRIAPAGKVPNLAHTLLADIALSRPSARSLASAHGPDERPPPAHADSPAEVRYETSRPSSRGATAAPMAVPEASPSAAYFAAAGIGVALASSPRPGIAPLVVIDPGHGGRDPGTESSGGIAEKTVALAIAQRLSAALESRGLRVDLTRDDDRFLSLGTRTQLANRAHADLFVSIHLNSSPDASVSGLETYYLNNTTDRATIRLAQMENGTGANYGQRAQPNLEYILTNLTQDYKANESASLARLIEAESAATIADATGIRVHALGAKQGPFYVLVGAEMPSVLVECGFLSNPTEAQLLTQPRYQQALADGIAAAVVHYFDADGAAGNL